MPAYSHLLDEERDQIAVMSAAGRSICAVAGALQRAKSTVSRELRRNALPSGRYSPLAHYYIVSFGADATPVDAPTSRRTPQPFHTTKIQSGH